MSAVLEGATAPVVVSDFVRAAVARMQLGAFSFDACIHTMAASYAYEAWVPTIRKCSLSRGLVSRLSSTGLLALGEFVIDSLAVPCYSMPFRYCACFCISYRNFNKDNDLRLPNFAILLVHPRQQSRIPPRRRGVNRHRLLRAKAVEVMRAARLGAGAGQAFAAKRLHPHHRADHELVPLDAPGSPSD